MRPLGITFNWKGFKYKAISPGRVLPPALCEARPFR